MLDTLDRLERLIRRDPGRRGLLAAELDGAEPLCRGELQAAARELSSRAVRVGIVTGFYVPDAALPAAETDGPPGAVTLARALLEVDVEVYLVTDELCRGAVQAAAVAAELEGCPVLAAPLSAERWCEEFWNREPGRGTSHLVAVERVGPCHTLQSLRRSLGLRTADHDASGSAQVAGPAFDVRSPPVEVGFATPAAGTNETEWAERLVRRFERSVPVSARGRCHNMRGVAIDQWTAALHRLFEPPCVPEAVRTVGIGDGGNEIGMGKLRWDVVAERLGGDRFARVPCRVATDWTVLAGTSNWGAYALAAAVLWLRGRPEVLRPWTSAWHRRLIEAEVADGPAVDGVTRQREATVDGLPFTTYIQPWEGIRETVLRA